MGGSNSWRTTTNGEDWVREIEKRILHEERRPFVTSASDLLGPGFTGPYATDIPDWNGDGAAFDGFFTSQPGALNAPDATSTWQGITIADDAGTGIQRVWALDGSAPPTEYVRTFVTNGSRTYTAWVQDTGGGSGGGTTPATPAHMLRHREGTASTVNSGTWFTMLTDANESSLGITYSNGLFTVHEDGVYDVSAGWIWDGTGNPGGRREMRVWVGATVAVNNTVSDHGGGQTYAQTNETPAA